MLAIIGIYAVAIAGTAVGGHWDLPAGGHQVETMALTEGEQQSSRYRLARSPYNADSVLPRGHHPWLCGPSFCASLSAGRRTGESPLDAAHQRPRRPTESDIHRARLGNFEVDPLRVVAGDGSSRDVPLRLRPLRTPAARDPGDGRPSWPLKAIPATAATALLIPT
jgi:hypothetical protein